MYRRILVPLDGSIRAEAILPQVEELARCFGSRVIFLRVVEAVSMFPFPPEGETFLASALEQAQQEAALYLNGLCGEFRERKIEAKVRVTSGPIVPAILEAAADENADLIAIASHGRTGLNRVFYGSIAAGVLHRVDRPLLLVRAEG